MKRVTRKLFLYWTVINSLILVGSVVALEHYIPTLNKLGKGYLFASIVLAIFIISTTYCGKLMWRTDKLLEENKSKNTHKWRTSRDAILHDLDHVIYAIEKLPFLGMVLTVLGLIIAVTSGFSHINSDLGSIVSAIHNVGNGMATAMISTFIAITGSLVLGVQSYLITRAIEKTDA